MASRGDDSSQGDKAMTLDEIKELEEEAKYIVQQLKIACSDQNGQCFYEQEFSDLSAIVLQLTTELRKNKGVKEKQYASETRH